MKKIFDVLEHEKFTPRERALLVIKNEIGEQPESVFSESEISRLTTLWRPKSNKDAEEYNKYIQIWDRYKKLQVIMVIEYQNLVIDILKILILTGNYEQRPDLVEDPEELLQYLLSRTGFHYTDLIGPDHYYIDPDVSEEDLKNMMEWVPCEKRCASKLMVTGNTLYNKKHSFMLAKEYRYCLEQVMHLGCFPILMEKYKVEDRISCFVAYKETSKKISRILDGDATYLAAQDLQDDLVKHISCLNMSQLQYIEKIINKLESDSCQSAHYFDIIYSWDKLIDVDAVKPKYLHKSLQWFNNEAKRLLGSEWTTD